MASNLDRRVSLLEARRADHRAAVDLTDAELLAIALPGYTGPGEPSDADLVAVLHRTFPDLRGQDHAFD